MQHVLVTGGAGFIGSHLVERLLAEGLRVRVVDSLVTGRAENLAQARERAGDRLELCTGDVTDAGHIASCCEGIDTVFHLAALADIVPSVEDPLRYHRANVDGTVTVLEAARRAGVERFVYAASSSCYGIPDHHPTGEEQPLAPEYPYALTKMLGEQYVLHWQRCYGLPAVSLRLFNVYGPRARTAGTYGAVFGVFLAQKRAGAPFTVVGDGHQTRDFVHVTDVAEAFLRAARSARAGRIYNVGAGRPVSIRRLVELLGGPVVQVPERPGEPACTHADIRRIQAELDWQPRVSIEEGVADLLARLDDWRDAPVWTPDRIAEATRAWFTHLDRTEPVGGR